jgi:hypothetical protein
MRSKKPGGVKSTDKVATLADAGKGRGRANSGARGPAVAGAGIEPPLDRYAGKWRWLEWLVPAILCALLLGQTLLSDNRISQTADESTHLYAGYRYWKCGDFGYGSEHPPLPKLVAAFPLLLASRAPADCTIKNDEADAALNWLYAMPDWEAVLTRARAAISLFALALCVLGWIAARRMFGFTVAVLAAALLAFDPNILASSGLVMTDMAVTFAYPFAVYTYYLYFRDRSRSRLVPAGVATGIALVAKNSGVVALPVLLLLALTDPFVLSVEKRTRLRSAISNLGGAMLICAIALGVLWAVYGLQFSARPHTDSDEYWAALPPPSDVVATLHDLNLLPEAYLGGWHAALGLATEDLGPFLFGHMFSHREWFFFPVVMLVKSTVAVLLLLALGMVGLRYLFPQRRRELLYLILPAGVFFLVCMFAVNSMMRHLLPIFPFAFILIAAAVVELAQRRRWVGYSVPMLLLFHIASSLHAYPFYLSYANEFFGGPSRLYKRLPYTDLGEGIKEVRAYVARNHSGPCWLLSAYQMNPDFYRTGCARLTSFVGGRRSPRPGIPPILSGTVFVSSSIHSDDTGMFTAFMRPPEDVIAGSAELVFKGDFDTRKLATQGESVAAQRSLDSGEFPDALLHARRAVDFDPTWSSVHALLCAALVANGSPPETRNECETAQGLLEKDSLTNTHTYELVHKYVSMFRSGEIPAIRNTP